MFVCEQVGCAPDMLVLGKASVAASFRWPRCSPAPISMSPPTAPSATTRTKKSSVGCAAALATLDVIADERLLARAGALGEMGHAALHAIAARHPAVRAVRSAGLYFGIELDSAERAERVLYDCLARGLSFKIGGSTVVTLCPAADHRGTRSAARVRHRGHVARGSDGIAGMLQVAFAVLSAAVLLGLLLAALYLRATDERYPPWWLGAAHGAGGSIGFVALLLALRGPTRGVANGVGSFGLVAAAMLGFGLLVGVAIPVLWRTRHALPGGAIAIHAIIAVSAT